MKKILSIILVFALLFSIAACNKIPKDEAFTVETTTTVAPPVIKEQKHHEEFKDENGRVVYVVDVVLPEVSYYANEAVKDYLNRVSNEIFEDACESAENNIKNASNFMDNLGFDKPWTNTITFETTYSDGRFTCFLIKDAFSYTGGEGDPLYKTKCFDLKYGEPCSARTFAIADFSMEDFNTSLVEALIIPTAQKEFYPNNPYSLSDEMIEKFRSEFTLQNFYITETGMAFYYDRTLFDGSLSGVYVCEFTWAELSSVFCSPEDVQAIEYAG